MGRQDRKSNYELGDEILKIDARERWSKAPTLCKKRKE